MKQILFYFLLFKPIFIFGSSEIPTFSEDGLRVRTDHPEFFEKIELTKDEILADTPPTREVKSYFFEVFLRQWMLYPNILAFTKKPAFIDPRMNSAFQRALRDFPEGFDPSELYAKNAEDIEKLFYISSADFKKFSNILSAIASFHKPLQVVKIEDFSKGLNSEVVRVELTNDRSYFLRPWNRKNANEVRKNLAESLSENIFQTNNYPRAIIRYYFLPGSSERFLGAFFEEVLGSEVAFNPWNILHFFEWGSNFEKKSHTLSLNEEFRFLFIERMWLSGNIDAYPQNFKVHDGNLKLFDAGASFFHFMIGDNLAYNPLFARNPKSIGCYLLENRGRTLGVRDLTFQNLHNRYSLVLNDREIAVLFLRMRMLVHFNTF